jgi:hypothetical protein
MLGRFFSVVLIITMLGVYSPAVATNYQIQNNYYKRIPIATTAGDEEYPDIAYCPGSGEYLVVYDADYVITGQRLDEFGIPIGDPFEISSGTADSGIFPKADCVKGDSEYFVVAWITYAEITLDNIQIQAVHGSHQTAPLSQLHGSPIMVPTTVSEELYPEVACSTDENNCLLVYQYMGDTMESRAQRLEVIESGITFVGDTFNFLLDDEYQSYPAVSWNSLDDNYLIAWEQSGNIGYVHVFGGEQGPGMDELQHAPAPLYITRGCRYPRVAHNPQTGKFMVVFTCEDSSGGDNDEIILQRVDGTGMGLQGAPVSFTHVGGTDEQGTIAADIWAVTRPSGESQFMIAVCSSQYTPSIYSWLFLLPIKGSYDPASTDQTDGESMLIWSGGEVYPGGAGDPMTGRFILVDEEGVWDGPNDLYAYLFAPYVNRFTVIFK